MVVFVLIWNLLYRTKTNKPLLRLLIPNAKFIFLIVHCQDTCRPLIIKILYNLVILS